MSGFEVSRSNRSPLSRGGSKRPGRRDDGTRASQPEQPHAYFELALVIQADDIHHAQRIIEQIEATLDRDVDVMSVHQLDVENAPGGESKWQPPKPNK